MLIRLCQSFKTVRYQLDFLYVDTHPLLLQNDSVLRLAKVRYGFSCVQAFSDMPKSLPKQYLSVSPQQHCFDFIYAG